MRSIFFYTRSIQARFGAAGSAVVFSIFSHQKAVRVGLAPAHLTIGGRYDTERILQEPGVA